MLFREVRLHGLAVHGEERGIVHRAEFEPGRAQGRVGRGLLHELARVGGGEGGMFRLEPGRELLAATRAVADLACR